LPFSRDSNSNGIVSYRLQQDSFLFSIDHYSGEIRLKNRPERYLSMNALEKYRKQQPPTKSADPCMFYTLQA
jgi:hypothetical protein